MAVVGVDFEPALGRCEPAIDNATYREPALPEPEPKWLLITAIAGVAFHANRHAVKIPRSTMNLKAPHISVASAGGNGLTVSHGTEPVAVA